MELKKNLNAKFASKLSTIEQEVETIWGKGELYHVYYTLHGLKHSNYVIDVLEKLIRGLNPTEHLNDTETFCLLSAAYLHDVGMQIQSPDDEKIAAQLSESKNKPYTVPDLIRDEHHKRSGRYIKEHANDLKLDHMESECIRLISEGHRQVKLESKDYEDQTIGLEVVRIRLLSALLRLADELDITYQRAPKIIFDVLKVDMPDDSYLQWIKHYYTSGVRIDTLQQENGKKKTSIEVSCYYPNEDVGR
ncbi:MAG: HD domain-containing protein, partial [Methanosarcinaceae archaeon]|nr:HD domain-containing protein [Methanosarcinaceae archaeon]